AKAVGQYADGVIVGSELVKNFADVGNDEQKIAHAKKAILDKMDELREAIDSLE
ncbi:tryptophan synthase subunit alpha, partial [Salmonella enterica subsp. enterica]|nr:tryptophan synthase subunit alpha [Salmonella enterica subsp. enterica]